MELQRGSGSIADSRRPKRAEKRALRSGSTTSKGGEHVVDFKYWGSFALRAPILATRDPASPHQVVTTTQRPNFCSTLSFSGLLPTPAGDSILTQDDSGPKLEEPQTESNTEPQEEELASDKDESDIIVAAIVAPIPLACVPICEGEQTSLTGDSPLVAVDSGTEVVSELPATEVSAVAPNQSTDRSHKSEEPRPISKSLGGQTKEIALRSGRSEFDCGCEAKRSVAIIDRSWTWQEDRIENNRGTEGQPYGSRHTNKGEPARQEIDECHNPCRARTCRYQEISVRYEGR